MKSKNQKRLIWASTRSFMEAEKLKHLKYGKKASRKWSLFESLISIFGFFLKITPLYSIGYKNALNTVVIEVDLYFEELPEDFNGYTILHLTDLHLDSLPDTDKRICKKAEGIRVDLCVLTGDYRLKTMGGFKNIIEPMKRIVSCIDRKDGIMAVLGNHDTWDMADAFEEMGITMLINESTFITRGRSRIHITGVDDPYYYYTDQAISAMEESPKGFKIILVHTPSLFDIAADNGFSLYLTGHTHGGQICLPGGIPVIRHLRHGKKFFRGSWNYKKMTGYTGQGVGSVGIPVRFNTQSEITLLRLFRKRGG